MAAGMVPSPALHFGPAGADLPAMSPPVPAKSALVGALATIYLVWGSTYLAMRVAVESMPPFAMAGARFLIGGSMLFLLLAARGGGRTTVRQWIDNSIIGTLLLLGGNGLVAWSLQYLPSGVVALLIGVGPVFIVLTDWAWPGGERPTGITLGALLLGFGGIAWLAAPWEQGAGATLHAGGVMVVLAACVFWAVGSIYSRHAKSGASPFMSAAQQMLGGGAAVLLVSWLTGDLARVEVGAITARSWLAFGFLVLIGSLVGFSTFVWLMKNAKPALAATYAYVNPVVAVLLGWLLLNEPITGRTVIAAVIIITSVAIITTQKNRGRLTTPPRQAVVPPAGDSRDV